MTKYDFETLVDRKNTSCYKWDLCDKIFGGTDLLPLWVADMDFLCPPEILSKIQERARHPVFGYTSQPESLKEAICFWNKKRHHWNFSQDDLFFLPGVVPSLIVALHAFSKPQDKVIIQPPVYHPFFDVIQKNERILVENPLVLQGDKYVMDFSHLRSVIKGAKIFILCNPHNPGGRAWTKEELLELGKICLEEKVIILSDEIHSDIIFSPHKHTPIATLSPELKEQTLTFMAPSKTFNIAGLMLSFAIVENPKLKKAFAEKRQALGHMSNNPFAIEAAEVAYREGELWLEELLIYLKGNLEFIDSFLKKNSPQIKHIRPEATYLTWLDMKKTGLSEEEIQRRLLHVAKLALNDGKQFGNEGQLYRRLNFACPRPFLQKALEALAQAFSS